MIPPRWSLLPAFIVRPAGFSLDRLRALRFERSAQAARELAEASAARRTAGDAFDAACSQFRYQDNPAFDDPAVRKALGKHIKQARAFARQSQGAVPRDAIAETARIVAGVAGLARALVSAHERLAAAEAAYHHVFSSELETLRGTLRDTYAADERLQEAVFLESPEAYERIVQLLGNPGPRDQRARQRERLATLYLQRFCAKNDTNSICGPHAVGWFREGRVERELVLQQGGEHRRTYVSHWAATRLLEQAAQRRTPDALIVRVNPTARLDGARLAWCVMEHDATKAFHRRYSRAELPGLALDVFQLAFEPRTLAALVQLAEQRLDAPTEDIRAVIEELCSVGALLRHPAIPTGLFRPLDYVIDRATDWPGGEASRWLADTARALRAEVDAFASAGLAGRLLAYTRSGNVFRDATGDAAERAQGQHYADRSILHEDCHASARIAVGDETAAPLLAAIGPLLQAAALPLELARENVRAWFRARFAERRVPVIEVHRAFDEDRAGELRVARTDCAVALGDAIARVRAVIGDAVAAARDGVAEMSSTALAEAARSPLDDRSAYASIDLMLAQRSDGDNDLVLGEVHGFCWLPTCLLDVVPPAELARVLACMRDTLGELAGGRPTLECLFAHTQATDRRFPLADADLWLIDRGDRAGIGLGALDMQLVADRFRFLDRDREVVPVSIYETYPFFHYTSPLAPLVDDFAGKFFPEALLPDSLRVGDSPRLRVDHLTFRRRTWRRTAREMQMMFGEVKEHELFARAHELRARLACGSTVFVTLATEPKPVFLDFENFFLVEVFAHLLGRQHPDSVIRMTEMLPGPDELVARAADGRRTSELRIGVNRVADG